MQVMVLDRYETVRAVLGDGPSACPLLEDTYKETLENAAVTYEFAVPADHPDAQAIEPEGYVLLKDLDGNLLQLRIKIVEDDVDAEEGRRIRRVTCENAALELNGAIVRPQTWTWITAEQALTNALAGTRWQPGVVEWAGLKTIQIEEYQTVTATLHQIASEFGGELRWRVEWRDGRIVGRYVDMLKRRGRVTGKRFEYRQDIRGLKRVEDTTELVTAMIGLGKSDDKGQRLTFASVEWSRSKGDPVDKPLGQDWVGDPDALERWGLPGGRHLFGVFEDSEEDNPEELLQKTWDALQQRIQGRFTYEVEVAVLEHIAGLEHEAVRLGDTVTIHDASVDPPMALEARVIEIERSYTDPSRDKVTLGQYRQLVITLPKVVAELQKRLNAKQGEWDAKQASVHQGPTPPDNPADGQLWLDTSQTPNVWRRWDGPGNQWVRATPTEAAEVKAETPEGAQQKADQAREDAKQAVASGEVPLPVGALVGQITSEQIANAVILAQHLAQQVIQGQHIAPGAITGDKLAIGSITENKMRWSTHLLY
ncbi:phage tail spike protein [Thermaerobacter composti]|uniref:Phage tail spike protein n=1 Tax=Thermaerobacter composti TaxID=554949 RepID=A0ABZ0QRQ6_9FIRM|nr:phage tail spike protein [Thermaerobacter composti]WPD20173.1 phage tail spike protein [Thermaerobacter composti]